DTTIGLDIAKSVFSGPRHRRGRARCVTACMFGSSESWASAPTSMALTCRWRSRPRHQKRRSRRLVAYFVRAPDKPVGDGTDRLHRRLLEFERSVARQFFSNEYDCLSAWHCERKRWAVIHVHTDYRPVPMLCSL